LLGPGGGRRERRFDGEGLARSYVELRRRGHVRGDLGPRLREAIYSLSREATLPASAELFEMCSRIDELMPDAMTAPRVPRETRPDYLALVLEHNPRKKR